MWSGRRGSNSRHSAWKADALPTELLPLVWAGKDSNLRRLSQQIYSLPPLATWVPAPKSNRFYENPVLLCTHSFKFKSKSWRRDLNPRPADYKSAALPAELRQHRESYLHKSLPLYAKNLKWSRFFTKSLNGLDHLPTNEQDNDH